MRVVIIGMPNSGKTTLLKKLQDAGAKVFHADSFINKEYLVGGKGYNIIKEWFDPSFITPKAVNRKVLAKWVLQDPDNLIRLDELIHPIIKDYLEGKDNYVAELPIITNSPIKFEFDKIILVTAGKETIRKRMITKGQNPDFLQLMVDKWDNNIAFDYVVDTTNGISDDVIQEIIQKFNLVHETK